MQRADCGWAALVFGLLLAAPAGAQLNQLAFRGAPRALEAPAAFARISDAPGAAISAAERRAALRGVLDAALPEDAAARTIPAAYHDAPAPAPIIASPIAAPHGIASAHEVWGEPVAGCEAPQPTACGAPCGGSCQVCCGPGAHRTSIYGGYVLLQARDAEVAYAVPIDGPIINNPPANPVQVGDYGIVDPDYDSGFLAGVNFALDQCASIDVRYFGYDSSTTDAISTEPPDVIRSLVSHPSSTSAAQDFLAGEASLDLDLDVIDATYRSLWNCGSNCPVNWLVGTRYGQLDQRFQADFLNNGTETVSTDIDFEGTGLRLGLESARYYMPFQMYGFANGSASFLAGRFRGAYFQGQSFDPEVVNTEWEASRVVPVLDVEAGLGWSSRTGRLKLSSSYLFSGWYNMVKTQDFIEAMQANQLTGLSETLSFDGWTFRAEWNF